MMAGVIAGLLLALPVSLTFEAHSERVKSVVERLSQETRTPLLCANDVGSREVTATVSELANAQRGSWHAPRNAASMALSMPKIGEGDEPRFRMGKAVRYDFTIEQPKLRMTANGMMDHWVDLSRPAVAFSQLPDTFRQKVAAVRKGD